MGVNDNDNDELGNNPSDKIGTPSDQVTPEETKEENSRSEEERIHDSEEKTLQLDSRKLGRGIMRVNDNDSDELGNNPPDTSEQATPEENKEENSRSEKERIHDPEEKTFDLKIDITSLARQHHLAYIFFKSREDWTHSIILIVCSLLSGILSFLASLGGDEIITVSMINGTVQEAQEDSDTLIGNDPIIPSRTRAIFSIVVGTISFFQVAVQKMGKTNNYGARSEMHNQVSMGLFRLLEKIERDERVSKEDGQISPTTERVATYYEVIEQCLSSCTSALPIRIVSAFDVLKGLMKQSLRHSQIRRGVEKRRFKTTDRALLTHAFTALNYQISSDFLWPWRIMDPQVASDNAYVAVTEMLHASSMLFIDRKLNRKLMKDIEKNIEEGDYEYRMKYLEEQQKRGGSHSWVPSGKKQSKDDESEDNKNKA